MDYFEAKALAISLMKDGDEIMAKARLAETFGQRGKAAAMYHSAHCKYTHAAKLAGMMAAPEAEAKANEFAYEADLNSKTASSLYHLNRYGCVSDAEYFAKFEGSPAATNIGPREDLYAVACDFQAASYSLSLATIRSDFIEMAKYAIAALSHLHRAQQIYKRNNRTAQAKALQVDIDMLSVRAEGYIKLATEHIKETLITTKLNNPDNLVKL